MTQLQKKSEFSLPAPIILGSQSPRRQELLGALGIPFDVIVRPTDEAILPNMSPLEAVAYIAENKGLAFLDKKETHIIITSDTIVVLNEEIIGKPVDEADAIRMLSLLSGNMHFVYTAVCILYQNQKVSFVEQTKVFFRELSPEEINYYVKTYKPFDKAGSYGVQEWLGMTAITKIEGDFYNVMGLPVSRVWRELKGIK